MKQTITPTGREKKLDANDFIVSKTDLKGKLTYCNRIFIDLAGYSEAELLGKAHNIVRHPKMPRVIFKLLWDRVKAKKEIFAFVINLCKDGGHYWVYANVTASTDANGKVLGYYSVRRKPAKKAVETIEKLYETLLQKERNGGMEESMRYLDSLLEQKGVSYDEYVAQLQKGD
ncbi:MAG: PAS domain-containing protein [Campylobacterota bacterium]